MGDRNHKVRAAGRLSKKIYHAPLFCGGFVYVIYIDFGFHPERFGSWN
jgi:hypothetical protein